MVRINQLNEEAKPKIIKEEKNAKQVLLIITDRRGIPLACNDAISGNHNDAYELKENVQQMLQSIEAPDIDTIGLFLYADSGFDSKEFREYRVSKDIIGNLAINPRNGNNENYLFDDLFIQK